MRRIFPIVVLSLLALGLPAGAQAAPEPATACREDCTAAEANDGAVAAGLEPVNVILYAHIDGLFGWGSLNTQMPGLEEEMGDEGFGYTMPTMTTNTDICGPLPTTCMDMRFSHNEMTLTVGGPTFVAEDGTWSPTWHQDLGAVPELTGDALRLFWYMSADATPTGEGVGAVADLKLSARLESGWPFDDARLVAESPASSAFTATPIVTLPTGRSVYELSVDLEPVSNAAQQIDKGEHLSLSVKWDQVKVANVAEFVQRDWRVHAGPRFLPRLIVPLYEPVKVVSQDASPYDGKLYFRWSVLPALGDYDVRDESVRMEIVSAPAGARPAIDHINLKRSLNCGASDPIKSSWSLSYREEPLPDGNYVLRASILNGQGTYVASSLFQFNVTGGVPDGAPVFTGEASVPGPGLPILLGIVVLCVAGLRRRGAI